MTTELRYFRHKSMVNSTIGGTFVLLGSTGFQWRTERAASNDRRPFAKAADTAGERPGGSFPLT
jgi:hypothetical protein